MENTPGQGPTCWEWTKAVKSRDIQSITKMLALGFDPNAWLQDIACSAISIALWAQDAEFVRLLLANGADPNLVSSTMETPTTGAIELARRHPELDQPRVLLELLLAAGAKLRVLEAVVMEDVELARKRLEEGEDPDYGEDSYHGPLLMSASVSGHIGLVNMLLDHGADIEAMDDLGQRSLICAADEGHVEVVARLLDRGAEIDAVDWFGRSALACAAANDHREVCRLLISRGAARGLIDLMVFADLEHFEKLLDKRMAEDDVLLEPGYTGSVGRLSMLAAKLGATEALKLLLDRGIPQCNPDWDKHSLLAEAAIHGRLETIDLLLDRGADVREVGRDRTTPLRCAIEAEQLGAADLLRKAGAVR